MRISSGIRKAYKQALKSERACRHGAVLTKSGKPVAFGVNKRKTHPLSMNIYQWLHAEVDCVLKRRWDGLEGLELFVARAERRDDVISNSKPCQDCQCVIKQSGINIVYYSICNEYVGFWCVRTDSWGKIRLKKKIEVQSAL